MKIIVRGDDMLLKIGTILTLEPTYTDKVERLQSKVVEQRENIIFIDYPVSLQTNKTVFLIDGTQFRATFRTENNENYAFNTEVLGRTYQNIPMIMLHLPPKDEFIKIQRREFVRVNTPTDVAVKYKNEYYQYVTEDISAGGLALKSQRPFPFQEKENVELTIVLPYSNGDINYVLTKAKVIRIFERDNLNIASMQFIETDDVDQQQIVRFCFERQLLLRKKSVEI